MDKISRSTRREYVARINRVLDYIRNNLDRRLPLDELAGVAAFSPFHFHRIFKGMTGENLNDYVVRLRLEKAAAMLINQSDTSVTEICLSCGFSSSSNFAKAFKRHFGCNASDFRFRKIRQPIRKHGERKGKIREDFPLLGGYAGGNNINPDTQERRNETMKVDVKQLPGYRVAYVRVMGGLDTKLIAPAFQKVISWAKARDLMGPETLVIGVCLDNPEVTPKDKCHYDACVTVPSGIQADGEIGIYDIPAGKYAVYRVEGQYAKINAQMGKAWDRLMGQWFPDSGYQPDDRPCFEIYRESEAEYKAGKFIVDLCEPVRPL